jgi:hypothetical protein
LESRLPGFVFILKLIINLQSCVGYIPSIRKIKEKSII